MLEAREVDPSPVQRVALRDVETFGVRPRSPVDDERRATEPARTQRIEDEPPADDEHAIARSPRCVRRLDDDGAVQLTVFGAPAKDRGASRLSGVVVGATFGGAEANLTEALRLDPDAIAG